ncbi:MAG TPA: tRNA pseudouridine synthase A [Lachnospiraceae bacterium]|nr:tRNA pseudouridine synthase A [Lachnospiraceae bacterium]
MHKRNIRLSIQYDGTRYLGWQRLGGENTSRSIQGIIEQHLSTIINENIKIVGSGRTDAGVHALCQVANFFTHSNMECVEIGNALNRLLPEDIAINCVDEVPLTFHSRYSALSKTYEYLIEMGERQSVFNRRYSCFVEGELNTERMRQAAEYLVGKHDFASFRTERGGKEETEGGNEITTLKERKVNDSELIVKGKSSVPKENDADTIRTIYSITIEEHEHYHRKDIRIRFHGEGFLYNMVRIMVGTLVEVGLGKREPIDVKRALEYSSRQLAGITMAPQGLFLVEVEY